ncbi:MAG TPA: hypothetical protein VH112_04435 [Acidimicrobiales bacterium]|jgi:hypothetical protein|nr:hypothetical protein [Acidimicrobiales bacterium]
MMLATATETQVVPTGGYRAAGVLRSEWTKFSTVRSSTLTIAALVGVTILIGALTSASEASNWASLSPFRRAAFDPTNFSLNGLLFGQLAVGVLGALVMSSEYGTGLIRSTLAAVPNRRLVLGAKAAVLAGVVLLVGEIVSFSSFFLGQAILSGSAPSAGIGDPGVLQAVVGGGLYLAVLALLGLGIATIVRHTAGAISSFVGIVLIAPLIVQALPSSIGDAVGKYLPVNIGHALTSVQPQAHAFSPWVGFGLLGAYAAVALALGGWLMVRRDA